MRKPFDFTFWSVVVALAIVLPPLYDDSYVMAELARLEDEGRIEVLRENRDHYHVFAFIDGARPDETLINESLGKARVNAPDNMKIKERISQKEEKKVVRKKVKKEAAEKQNRAKSKRR